MLDDLLHHEQPLERRGQCASGAASDGDAEDGLELSGQASPDERQQAEMVVDGGGGGGGAIGVGGDDLPRSTHCLGQENGGAAAATAAASTTYCHDD